MGEMKERNVDQDAAKTREAEVRRALKRIKAVGPDKKKKKTCGCMEVCRVYD